MALKDVTIFSTAMNAGIDVLFGNLGQDFVDGFDSFTLDFSTMMFHLGAPMAEERGGGSSDPPSAVGSKDPTPRRTIGVQP